MTFLGNNTIWYAFYSKFATSRVFFRKTHLFLQKRPKFWTFWEILLFQSHSTANLLQFGQKIISRWQVWTNLPMWRECNWQTSGKKKRRKWPIWVENFAFVFLRTWRKIINIWIFCGKWQNFELDEAFHRLYFPDKSAGSTVFSGNRGSSGMKLELENFPIFHQFCPGRWNFSRQRCC